MNNKRNLKQTLMHKLKGRKNLGRSLKRQMYQLQKYRAGRDQGIYLWSRRVFKETIQFLIWSQA